MTSRSIAQAKHERTAALVGKSHLDWCGNTFGVAPCTATGTQCYQTYGTCKDQAHFTRSSKVRQYCNRGMPQVAGETIRPYIIDHAFSPTELKLGGGLAGRSNVTVKMADEVCNDVEDDPYIASRSAPAQGTYQTRLLARNYNYVSRFFELLKGYVVQPFDWTTFQTELYVIDKIAGPDKDGNVTYTLSDIVKLLDKSMLPQPRSGTLQADCKAIEYTGYLLAADATHITLAADASAVNSAYVGMEAYISQNTSAGERRVISAYNGETRVATLSSAWTIVPDTTSVVQVSALSINVGSGLGAQYNDPAVTGNQEFVCIGKEQIRYTAISGDVLSWPDSTYRAQWGTSREDHSANDGISQVLAFVDKTFSYAVQYLLNQAGVSNTYIDLTGLAQEDADWIGLAGHITASVSFKPEKISGLLDELLRDFATMSWWDPVAQQQKFKCDMPTLPGTPKEITPTELVEQTTEIANQDALRLTQSILSYAPYSATGQMSDRTNFQTTEWAEDAGAEGPNEYGAVIQEQRYSRWLTASNALWANALVTRRLIRLRNAPVQADFELDPRDEVALSDLVNVTSRKRTDITGAPLKVQMRVTRLLEDGNFKVRALSTSFSGRPGFIAPDPDADYPTETAYCHISNSSGLMSDGTEGYTQI